MRAHLEALGVPEVRKERLHEVSILCRDDDDIRLSANLRKGLKLLELRPVPDPAVHGAEIERQRPRVLCRDGHGGEGEWIFNNMYIINRELLIQLAAEAASLNQ